MIKVEVSILINRSVEDVWDFMVDLKNTPKWDIGVNETRQTSSGPIGLGTTFQNIGPFMGKNTVREYQFIEFEPNTKATVTMLNPAGNIKAAQVSYIVEATQAGTKLTCAGQVQIGGWSKLLKPFIVRSAKKNTLGDLKNVKRLLES